MISSQVLVLPTILMGWRNKNNISLAAIAAATNINPRYLEAIENGEFHKLPGGVYGVSYVRQYARAIQYDEDELVGYYRKAGLPEVHLPELPARSQKWTRVLECVCSPWLVSKCRGLLQTGAK
jgi:cytoskeletal protein RodZ